MKRYPIIWKEEYPNISDRLIGIVNGMCMFLIDKKGVKKVTYVLQSNPFHNGVFVRGNNTKKLHEDSSLEIVKMFADSNLKIFTELFMKPAELEPTTLALFSMFHAYANPGRVISISDVDELLLLAKKFEKRYKETEGKDWEKSRTPWEDAVSNFYNTNKPHYWNHIE